MEKNEKFPLRLRMEKHGHFDVTKVAAAISFSKGGMSAVVRGQVKAGRAVLAALADFLQEEFATIERDYLRGRYRYLMEQARALRRIPGVVPRSKRLRRSA